MNESVSAHRNKEQTYVNMSASTGYAATSEAAATSVQGPEVEGHIMHTVSVR